MKLLLSIFLMLILSACANPVEPAPAVAPEPIPVPIVIVPEPVRAPIVTVDVPSPRVSPRKAETAARKAEDIPCDT